MSVFQKRIVTAREKLEALKYYCTVVHTGVGDFTEIMSIFGMWLVPETLLWTLEWLCEAHLKNKDVPNIMQWDG